MITFDHPKLVRRQPREMKKFRRWLLGIQSGDIGEVLVLHDANGDCCRQEPWLTTVAEIAAALKPTTRLVMANMPIRGGKR